MIQIQLSSWRHAVRSAPLALLLTMGGAAVRAQVPASLTSGQPTIPAGTQATLSGRNFAAGETVTVSVTHVRGTPTVGTNHTPAQVVADPGGAFTATWQVCSNDCVGELLQVEATGQTSGRVGRAVFLDLPPLPARPATWVRMDKPDYAPGTTANITGGGFQAGETVVLQVVHADGTPDTGADHTPWSVTANPAGGYQSTWQVCTDDCLHSTLKLTATGQASGKAAQAIFTDAGGAPTLERLKSFGNPSPGGYPVGGLLKGPGGTLYGTASGGGTGSSGTVFKLNPDGTGFSVLKNFDFYTTGGSPQGKLMLGTDGKLYGTCSQGGISSLGTVFRLNTDGSSFEVLANLDFSLTGAYPRGELVQGPDGTLYGTCPYGGSGGYGTIFKLNPDGSGLSIVLSLDFATTGANPFAGLLLGIDGALYGTCIAGGAGLVGTIFKLHPDGTGFMVLENLDYSTGEYSYAKLLQANDGKLYGTAYLGGSGGYGTVFSLNPDGTGFQVLKDFDSTSGSYPFGGLIQGTDGKLYGTCSSGGSGGAGIIFKINTDGTGFLPVLQLDYITTGGAPYGELVQGAGSTLFAITSYGGSSYAGTIFSISEDGSTFSLLKTLSAGVDISSEGGYPGARLMQGTDGKLYGTTWLGGPLGYGTAFKMNADGTGFVVLKNFDYVTTGGSPLSLAQGLDGALYGATAVGGAGGYGTLFKLNTDGTGFTVLKNLDYSTTGAAPYAGLTVGSDGTLYGTCSYGGSGYYGTLFKMNPDGTGFVVLKSFDSYTSGGYLYCRLLFGADGAIYGTANEGPNYAPGEVFRINPDGTGFAVLATFDYYGAAGFSPLAGLTRATNGDLYGSCASGGSSGVGTLFRLHPDGTGLTLLHDFDAATTGDLPNDTLTQAADGNLYGTAIYNGNGGFGTAFRIGLDGTGFEVLQNFDSGANGGYPFGGLIQSADGNLYGSTYQGGDANAGTIYRLVFTPTVPPNNPPVARCKNVTVSADASCTAAASIDNGSSDPDSGDTITLTQTPPGPYPLGNTLVTLTVTDNHGASSTCSSTVTVVDTTPPSITCPANMSVGCSIDRLAVVTYAAPVASDTCDPHPMVTCTPASGAASFPIGVTTVQCQAVDASGNSSTCSFTVTRAPLGFTGFLSPIGGEVALGTGGSFGNPLRAFKFGSTIPIKFSASCGGSPVSTGVHTLQVTKYSSSVDSDPAIDATPTDAATAGNQFQLTDPTNGEWHFNLSTQPLSVGTWKLTATLSDGSVHEVWITIKK